MKKIILLLVILFSLHSTAIASDKARGVFFGVGVGPRLPITQFSQTSLLGYGFHFELSYTDNESLPFFLYGKIGFEQFPGSQTYYQSSEYSHFSTSVLPIQLGVRHYFSPMLENVIVILPHIEAAACFSVNQTLHHFKQSANRPSYIEQTTDFGANIGIGASMFLLEMTGSYTYFKERQYLGFDLKIRLPLFVIF
ncbi:MAG: hypothetical protein HUU54_00145 [Ignavibacteriaceae bacterium]|nr:hypothetical protein [Ignavibacteriaceae bacterium]